MSSSNYACSVCDTDYDLDVHKPLVLPCSHSFCKDCLIKVQPKHCPICRYNCQEIEVDSLVFCRQLIRSEEPNAAVSCTDHNIVVIFWCPDCKKALCKACAVTDHKNCAYLLIENKNDESLKLFEMTAQQAQTKMTEKIETCLTRNNEILENIQASIDILNLHEVELREHRETLIAMKNNIIDEVANIKTFPADLAIAEDNLPTIQEKIAIVEEMGNREVPPQPATPPVNVPRIPAEVLPPPPIPADICELVESLQQRIFEFNRVIPCEVDQSSPHHYHRF